MKKLIIAFISALLIFYPSASVFAIGYNPFESYVRVISSTDSFMFSHSQDMYKSSDIISGYFEKPEHVDLFEDKLFVADSGLQAIVIVTVSGEYVNTIGEGVLTEPTGVYADSNYIYVADYGSNTVFKFTHDDELVMSYTRPTSPLFGKNEKFRPMKVIADNAESIFVISEGGTNGVIQMNESGEFLGFFGVNTSRVTLKMMLQRIFFTSEQRGQLLAVKPPSPDTLTIDSNGLIYTLTKNDYSEQIKKLNIAGKNVLTDVFAFDDIVDIAVDNDGNIFYLSSSGFGFYDSFGNLINANFQEDSSKEILGLYRQATSIAVDDNKTIYITDMEKGQIIKLIPTETANLVFEGIYAYKEGLYVESMDIWEEVLSLNTNFALAHNAMAKAYYKLGDYDLSLDEYKLSSDKAGYSNSFWQLRNSWLQNNLGTIIVAFIIIFVLLKVLKQIDKRKNIYDGLRRFKAKVKQTRFHREILPLFTVLRHPIDTCDYIKRLKKVSYAGFFIMFGMLVVTQLLFGYAKGYVFTTHYRGHMDWFSILIMTTVPLFVFVIANYLVSTITDGEGSFKGILIGTTASFSPVILFALPVSIITNFLTVNEVFIYDFSMFVLFGWSLINVFIVTMTIHDYTFGKAIKNLLLTAAGMVILLIVSMISYVLFDQFVKFVLNFR